MKKKLAILGATETMGAHALEIVAKHPGNFAIEALTTFDNADKIIRQAKAFQPNTIVVIDEKAHDKVKNALSRTDIKVFCGQEALCDLVSWTSIDMVLVATVGFDSIRPTLAALKAKKTVAVSNKEILAAAGEAIRKTALENEAVLLPASRALSAVFQSLIGEANRDISKITLMASGGPFLDRKPNYLVNVKKDHALQHPNQNIFTDDKTSIDASTLMGKGLEMIAARAMFNLQNDQLEVIIHPQSVIQSMVQLKDGSIKTQIGLPDIHVPLLYALSFPERLVDDHQAFPFNEYHKLTFDQPDYKTFRNLKLAQEAMATGHNAPCILNAANEVVVQAFLNNRVGFLEMSDMIAEALQQIPIIENPSLEDLEHTDEETRKLTLTLTKNSQLYN
ncbi:MAG TPA: 1-deoxy-D-xylulose-5-phosphate reductoisomerase [Edaphocola sp.]|nr:1-deoxy-D-xylulose-5-phosphate reductoisomerase [Edaphocola sp.]